jgi:tryptophanyl-tRNA synthetase
MAKILTGIQSTGTPHLGNLLGAILPAIQMANNPANESFLFIADLHSITQIKNGAELHGWLVDWTQIKPCFTDNPICRKRQNCLGI